MIWIFGTAVGGEADTCPKGIFMLTKPKKLFRRKYIGKHMFKGHIKLKIGTSVAVLHCYSTISLSRKRLCREETQKPVLCNPSQTLGLCFVIILKINQLITNS